MVLGGPANSLHAQWCLTASPVALRPTFTGGLPLSFGGKPKGELLHIILQFLIINCQWEDLLPHQIRLDLMDVTTREPYNTHKPKQAFIPKGDAMFTTKRLQDRVAVITGSSRGIGRDIALALAQEGCHIVVTAKTTEPTPKLPGTIYTVADEVKAFGVQALPLACDVRSAEAIQAMVEQTKTHFGRIDILVNNAGALWWEPVLKTPAKRFDLVMDVNVRASFLTAQAVLPAMIERQWGHIINMSPPINYDHLANRVGYMISKFGMTMLSMGLAEEMRPHNIAVNSLWPVTLIESLATINWGLGGPEMWRKGTIMADAVVAMVTREPMACTGQALLDEPVLREAGVTDFEPYSCVPGSQPADINSFWDK